MSSTAMDLFRTDDLTVILAVCFVTVYGISKFLKPQSLVHPLLLGRQADVGRVRMPGESAIYRNYATGIISRLPERPKPEVKLLSDLLPVDNVTRRRLWSTTITNAELKERAEVFGVGLTQIAGLVPRESTALLLIDDSIEFLVADLALANNSITSFTLSSLSFLIPTLEKHAPATIIIRERFLEHILDCVANIRQSSHHSIIVIGDEKQNSSSVLQAQKSGIRILRWEDLETKGKSVQKLDIPAPEPDDIFTVSLFDYVDGNLYGAQITHANVIAGVTAGRLFFPLADTISTSDTLLSVFPMSTAFGRSIAYTALYQGAQYTSLPTVFLLDGKPDTKSESECLLEFCAESGSSPTLFFLTPNYLKPLTNGILGAAKSSFLYNLGWRHKMSGLCEGFLTKISFWDNLVWGGARFHVLDKIDMSLRGILVAGGGGALDAAELETSRIALSVPIVSAYSHPLVCGPVMTSHPYDLQSFPTNAGTVAHVGPPCPNIEAKLVGVVDSNVEQGGDPAGILSIRGPSICQSLGQAAIDSEGWLITGQRARIQTNGTFKTL